MSESGILEAGWKLAANDEGVLAHGRRDMLADPEAIAIICASRTGAPGFRILAAPGTLIPLARDARGIFHFAGR